MPTRTTLRGESDTYWFYTAEEVSILESMNGAIRDLDASEYEDPCSLEVEALQAGVGHLSETMSAWLETLAASGATPSNFSPVPPEGSLLVTEGLHEDIEGLSESFGRWQETCFVAAPRETSPGVRGFLPPARRPLPAGFKMRVITHPLPSVVASRHREAGTPERGGTIRRDIFRDEGSERPPARDDSRTPVYTPPSSGAGTVILVGLGLVAVGGGIWYATRRKK